MPDKPPIDPKELAMMEFEARGIANVLERAINKDGVRRKGFMLALFSFQGSELTYISNADRGDMINLLKELLTRWGAGEPDTPLTSEHKI
jgi:hypothetical protein